jgi:GTP cyclohydrolase I
MNEQKVMDSVRTILDEIGDDPEREGILETPKRVMEMYKEVFRGLTDDSPNLKVFTNKDGYDQMIVETDIPYYSYCEHHLVPFFGKAYVGYIPNGKYVGLSKIVRTVDYFARKPQIQERLTEEIADYLFDGLTPQGLIVVVDGRHLCVESRGIKKSGVMTTTSAIRGDIDKSEFFDIISGSR